MLRPAEILARRWERVAWSMRAGALYDLGFALAILIFHRPAAAWMGLPLPEDPVYLRLNGILLALLAGLYALPGLWPERYQGVVGVAVAGRLVGFVFFADRWWAEGLPAFLLLALGDLAFSVAHAILLRLARSRTLSTQVHEIART